MKFRVKLLIGYMLIAALVTAGLAVSFYHYGEKRLRQSLFDQLFVEAKLIAEQFATEASLKSGPLVSRRIYDFARDTGNRVTLVKADGGVVADSAYDYRKMENHAKRPEIQAALAGRDSNAYRFSRTVNQELIYLAHPIRKKGVIIGAVRLARNQRELEKLLWHLRLLIIGGMTLTVFFTVGLGIMVMRRMTEPILELQRMAVGISKGDLSARVRYFGNDELADLGLTLNSMAQQLEDSFTLLQNEKHKLEVILENLIDGILVIDRNLNLILANPAAQEILGFSARDMQGRPLLEAVLNHHLLELLQEVKDHQEVIESELVLFYPKQKQLQVSLAPLGDETSVLAGSIVVLHDVTRIRRLERVRQDFVANVSHELRTPIASVKIMAETLLNGAWHDPQMLRRYLKAMNGECDRLSNLINDLLSLAKLDSKAEFTRGPVDLTELIQEVKTGFLAVRDQNVHLEIEDAEEPLPPACGNRDQLKQVLINLLDNAFKYTPSGGKVQVTVRRDGEMVKTVVSDTGIGIPGPDLDRIFERFYRVDKAHSREIGGTGLGLAIVKNIVESHGGKVEVESVLHQGSTFSFTVPVFKEI